MPAKRTARKTARRPARKTAKKATRKPARKTLKKTARKTLKKTARKPAKKTARKTTKNSAFMKPVQPDNILATVVGAKAIPRTEVVKKLWAYIKKYDLQDTKNRRNINADANLKKVFNGKVKVNMFEMTKLVSKHLK